MRYHVAPKTDACTLLAPLPEPNVSECVMCGARAFYPDPTNDQNRMLSLYSIR